MHLCVTIGGQGSRGEIAAAMFGKYMMPDIPEIDADDLIFILRAQDSLDEVAMETYRLSAAFHGRHLTSDLGKDVYSFGK